MIRALMIESKVPKHFWPEAIATSIYLINRLPTKILCMKTPLDTLSKLAKIPDHLNLSPKVFGCTVYVHIPKHERSKLSPCATKCVFVGYGLNQKGYRCYDPLTKKVTTTMNFNFLETEFFYHQSHLSSQGESDPGSTMDYLSWVVPVPNSSIEDPPDPAVTTAEQVSPQESAHPPQNSPPTISEVIPEPDPSSVSISTDFVNT